MSIWINRPKVEEKIRVALRRSPVVALLGPRQCGKSSLARGLNAPHFFDLEVDRDIESLKDPALTLESLKGLVVIDEIQFAPHIFAYLRTLVDRNAKRRFLILGSASRELVLQGAQSLAGRIEFVELGPFNIEEFLGSKTESLWIRGGFPKSALARSNEDSWIWRQNFIRTFLERDLSLLGFGGYQNLNRRFWTMLSHYHGQILNFSELGGSFGLNDKSVRKYVEALSMALMVRVLTPFHANVGKRVVKSPKLYLRDSGIFHSFQNIPNLQSLTTHPKCGASFEGFCIENVARIHGLASEQMFFYGTSGGAEIDLIVQGRRGLTGVEVKYSSAPSMTKALGVCQEDLGLKKIYIIAPTEKAYRLSKTIEVIPPAQIPIMNL